MVVRVKTQELLGLLCQHSKRDINSFNCARELCYIPLHMCNRFYVFEMIVRRTLCSSFILYGSICVLFVNIRGYCKSSGTERGKRARGNLEKEMA